MTMDIGEDRGGELGLLYGLNGGSGDVIEEQDMGGLKLPGGSIVNLVELVGKTEQIEDACTKVIPQLGEIAQKVIQDQRAWGRSGW